MGELAQDLAVIYPGAGHDTDFVFEVRADACGEGKETPPLSR